MRACFSVSRTAFHRDSGKENFRGMFEDFLRRIYEGPSSTVDFHAPSMKPMAYRRQFTAGTPGLPMGSVTLLNNTNFWRGPGRKFRSLMSYERSHVSFKSSLR